MLDFINKAVAKIFGTKSERDLKELIPYVERVNDEFRKLESISDDALRGKTGELKGIIADRLKGFDQKITDKRNQANAEETQIHEKESLFDEVDTLQKERDEELEVILMEILPQAFAVVKETARRYTQNKKLVVTATDWDREIAEYKDNVVIEGDKATWHNEWQAAGTTVTWEMIHYDVQIIGGLVLHQGKVAEMATGEGKTLVSTFPSYLNALPGLGVHLVTVNDYLAKRDSEWMAPLFEFHCLSVDCIDKYPPHSPERKAAYEADITYGTNNEFGFDYLRDNMANHPEELVQRKHHFAMVDEVDSVLIDEARTPLIISGPIPKGGDQEEQFYELRPRINRIVEAQKKVIGGYLNDAKRLIKEGNNEDGGLALFRAYRGLPKSKPLIKFLGEAGMKQLLQKTENIYIAENNKLMPEADAPLYFTIDEKTNSIDLTAKGLDLITGEGDDPDFFILPDISVSLDEVEKDTNLPEEDRLRRKEEIIDEYAAKSQRIHTTNQLLKAYCLFEKDVDYVVMDSKVMIVDEQTGRIMDGRRYSDGLHQAIEAKEGVKVEDATQTYATITLQNYFRMYHKLTGMTGTAETEAGEFWEIYKLDVVVIPTNRPIQRQDHEDLVYKTVREKFNAVIDETLKLREANRPILIGTTSVEISEVLSRMLKMRNIPHQVLNAKQHAKEADVVAEAGKPQTITIATNMAGRGTDIKLTPEAKAAGGLAIIGTERHESRRVDRQLRGRAGRQGDVGSSQFFVSLEDNLMRLFGSDRIANVMDKLGLEEGEVIQAGMVTKSIERAQKKVEENNFGIRKRLLEYDDVMNSQREVIYKRRHHALFGERLDFDLMNLFYDRSLNIIEGAKLRGNDFEDFKLNALSSFSFVPKSFTESDLAGKEDVAADKLFNEVYENYKKKMDAMTGQIVGLVQNIRAEKGDAIQRVVIPLTDGQRQMQVACDVDELIATKGKTFVQNVQKFATLSLIDESWKEHLRDMDDLKQNVQHAHYEQKDPVLQYKFKGFDLFQGLIAKLNSEVSSFLFKSGVPVRQQAPNQGQAPQRPPVDLTKKEEAPKPQPKPQEIKESHPSANALGGVLGGVAQQKAEQARKEAEAPQQPVKSDKTYGRNDRVNVRYSDGSVKEGVKFKTVENDVISGACVVLD